MYAILRTEKLKTAGNLGGLNNHLERKMEVPNADEDLQKFNRRELGCGDLVKDVRLRLEAKEITPRKNAVLAIEHLMTASPEAFEFTKVYNEEKKSYELRGKTEAIERWKAFEQNCHSWLKERYGEKNLVNFTVHMDEKTPHIHAVVVPIDEKGKLNCRHFLGGASKMREMQSSFSSVHEKIGLKRGVEGSKAEHQEVQKYYAAVKEFSNTPAEIKLSIPFATIEAPETTFLKQMKQDPLEYVKVQEESIKRQLIEQVRADRQVLSRKVEEMHKAASVAAALKMENTRLKSQVKGYEGQVINLKEEIKDLLDCGGQAKALLEGVIDGKVLPQDLKLATEKLPSPGNQYQKQIYDFLKSAGIEVKQEEKKLYITPKLKKDQGFSM